MARQIKKEKQNLVLGRVVDKGNRPLANLIVQAYDRDMRSEKLLGECITDKNGKYEINWLHRQLSGREVKEADIAIKVLTRERKTLLYESDMDSVRFNASPLEEINITITQQIEPEVTEYDHILKQVTYLAGRVAVADLQETEAQRDVTFLSKEAEIPAEKIEHLVVAHRLSKVSKIDAAFFYALLRKNTLLKNDFAGSFRARLMIGISTEIQTLLYDAALADPKAIQRDVEAAAKEMIVSSKTAGEWKRNADRLQQYRKRAEEYYKNEHPRKVLDIISRFVLGNKIEEMGKIYEENKNDLNAFFRKITDESFFKTNAKAAEAKASVALAELLGFDDLIVSQISESKNIKKPEDIRKLANLNKTAWKDELTRASGKIEIAGKPLDKKLIDLHASSIVRKLEKTYPTTAFAAQMAREKKPVLKNHNEITAFLSKHDDFDLQRHNVDIYLKDKKVSEKESKAIREGLKSVQRIFKLTPHYGKTNALLKENIHSAQSVVAVGETRFVNEIAPKAGMKAEEAKKIFRKAEQTNIAAMLIAGELQDTLRSLNVPALEMKSLPQKLEAVSKDFPNLKSLFKLTDTCACEHCRSVYSPAAYLVEILQFLDKRGVVDLTIPAPPPPAVRPTVKIAKDALFFHGVDANGKPIPRRADLGEIDLSCENANTPVPYIDLVCELLEESVAPEPGIAFTGDILADPAEPTGKASGTLISALQAAKMPVTDEAMIYATETTSGLSAPYYLRDKKAVCKIENTGGSNYIIKQLRQTLSSAEELAAAPEYVNADAYNALKSAQYAFTLPFDLDHVEAKAYFSRFDISRAGLMKDFQSAGIPADREIAAEKLGLTDEERKLITTPDTANQQKYWNTTSANASDDMKIVDTFLTKTGLTYQELDLLLSFKFIDPKDNLFIKHLDLSCDTEKKEIANLDDKALDRIHRFLRLQKKTGWKFEVLYEIISQSNLGKEQLDNACLIKAAGLVEISEQTGIKLDELAGFYREIPHRILKDDAAKPLYHQIFLNKAKNGFIDEGLLPEKVDGSQLLSDSKTSISVCLQIKEQDLDKLLPLLPNGNLTLSNLSRLFAASRLIKKLKLKTDEFVMLSELTGLNISDSPDKTLEFVKAANNLKKSPLKLSDIYFMLKHKTLNSSELAQFEIQNDTIKKMLETIQKEYQTNYSTNKSPYNDNLTSEEQKETLQTALSKLSGIGDDDVRTFIMFIDKEWTSANDAKSFADNKMSELFDTTLIKTSIDVLEAASSSDPDFGDKQNALIKAFLDAIADYQLQINKQSILNKTLTAAFKTDSELVKIILQYAVLKQTAPGTDAIADLLMTDTLIDKVNAKPALPAISDMAFPKQYDSIRLLHKMLPFINAFNLSSQEIEWFLKNNKDIGWFEWDSIPYKSGQTAADYARYATFVEIIEMSKQLTPVPNPADAVNPITFLTIAEMLLSSGTTRAQFLEAFSLLTGYDKDNADAVDGHLYTAWDINKYRDPKTWKSVKNCLEDLRKLGSTVKQVEAFIKPVLTESDVKTVRMALKARYDENMWLSTLKEIMDVIRPQKKDALVAYLLAINPEMRDENDLYDYFLIDVEMEACMPSSRIVQAHGAIQLFVQRCLMGLEPKAAADVKNDKNWEQWKWMKNYRIWEANRKVFLYPENWIEAELRDDKSFLFTELENELLQNELTEFTAEDALIKYLEKLDNIAFLEVMATWYQPDIKTMHVFARTKGGDPALYYYRRFEKERYWTPWERVELDITGDHLLAFVRNNRLCLAWLILSEEPKPDQKSKVPSASDQGKEIDPDRPKRKLKIQLAISEFADKKWQPKKISKAAIYSPETYTADAIDREYFKLFYNQLGNQIIIFEPVYDPYEHKYYWYSKLAGAFDIAGCKGYPELAPAKQFTLEFIPQFLDTILFFQRYEELDLVAGDDLSALNVHAFLSGKSRDVILNSTPDKFRITYPHQFTFLDVLAIIFEYLLFSSAHDKHGRDKKMYIPKGTLLPYFMEDRRHGYVIIPGFYAIKKDRETKDRETDEPEAVEHAAIERTVSDVLQLIEDIYALYKKYVAKYNADQQQDINALLQELVSDNDYHEIVAELKAYKSLSYGEQFRNMYHPLICSLRKTLYKDGIRELMKRETQLQKTEFDFEKHYSPNASIMPKTYVLDNAGVKTLSYPVEDLDFSVDGAYSGYNWELFFHVPFLLATRLTKNQRFEEALTWFHYMFNPTGALDGTSPEKYWVTKPFYQTHTSDYISQRIDELLYRIADPNTTERKELEFAIDQWRTKPFKPHVIARFRTVAYQKALVMKYIDNLTEWGDYLFRQDTMESIVQATQMYILADKLLGPKPRVIPPVIKAPYETFNQIEAKLDLFGNALIDLENILPDLSALPEGGMELPPAPVTLSMLYFCVPQNDKMLEYWDRIADRLFKIRHCQNIDGVERSLALFAPPIDPGMLIRAAAAGLDISSILAGINAPTPYYRFNVLSQKATELAQEVRALGNSLLQALEKKDAEAMALLRSELELKLLDAVVVVKKWQILEANEQIEALRRTRAVTDEKYKYYFHIHKIIAGEQLTLDLQKAAYEKQQSAQQINITASILGYMPNITIGASGFGGSPHVNVQWGTQNIISALQAKAASENMTASMYTYEASKASTLAGYDRRFDDWKLQERLANKELKSIDKQMVAAEIRKEIAEADLRNHTLQIENAKKTDEFMRSKFTNKELYDWMIGQISSVYFRAYQSAHDFAKRAERCYRFELGNDDSFISYGYWDSMKKGLQSADCLIHDIKRMESSYLDKNKREYEITKHISLSLLDPLALVRLRATGVCYFEVPEVLYDTDFPGQYFRRLKSVSISMPCIAGPYISVSAKLSLVSNRYRKNTAPGSGYAEDIGNDDRFTYNVGAIQSIATSSAQNDSGIFELNFRDERYLPFEGCGAISSWRLELPKEAKQFDYNTISDVVLHVKYTAREGGSSLKSSAEDALKTQLDIINQELKEKGLHIALNMKHDLPNEWHLFKKNGTVDLTIDRSRLPYMAQAADTTPSIASVMFIVKAKNNPENFTVSVDKVNTNLSSIDNIGKLCGGSVTTISLNTPFELSTTENLSDLEELMMVVKYSF